MEKAMSNFRIKPLNTRTRKSLPLFLTVEEVADILRVHTSTVYQYAKTGELPVIKIGNAIRIERDGLFYLCRKQEEPSA